ncbi:MAG: hypothetical protein LBD73_02505 [Deferribacteraceae bacterium]|jgi:uncharacterized membrane protein YcgQ (UPF0703/DUF1980 family)|nr:hypothetical protein [Deferribacteraceae bacterium]
MGELKKLLAAIPLIALAAILISLAAVADAKDKGGKKVVEIKERYFMAQCYDIMLNPEEYKNKLIKIQGIYFEEDGYKGIYRRTPGCCGDDGSIGFRIEFEGASPKADDWIEVIGSVEIAEYSAYEDIYIKAENEYIYLKAEKITILEKRGREFVQN